MLHPPSVFYCPSAFSTGHSLFRPLLTSAAAPCSLKWRRPIKLPMARVRLLLRFADAQCCRRAGESRVAFYVAIITIRLYMTIWLLDYQTIRLSDYVRLDYQTMYARLSDYVR
jgi:hypothetical protein